MSRPPLHWDQLRPHYGHVTDAFEELCCLLFKYSEDRLARIAAGWRFVRVGRPDGGVECFWHAPDGKFIGIQAKWFPTALSDAQWRQVDDSVKTAIDTRPTLTELTVCLPQDLPDPKTTDKKTGKPKTSARDKWVGRVKKWTGWAVAKGRTVAFHYWGTSELFEQLAEPRHVGRVRYFFDRELFNPAWFNRFVAEQIDNAGARYTPEVHVDLPIAHGLACLGRTPGYDATLREVLAGLGEPYHDLIRELEDQGLAEARERCTTAMVAFRALIDIFCRDPGDGYPDAFVTARSTLAEAEKAVAAALRSLADDPPRLPTDQSPRRRAERRFTAYYHAMTDVAEVCDSPATWAAVQRTLLLVGSGGTGKTHLLCDVAKHRAEAGLPTLLYLGQQMVARHPWPQLLERTGLAFASREEFLGALDTAGELSGRPALLVLDALNEVVDDPAAWQHEIAGLLATVRGYENIAVALSIRDSYLEYVVPAKVLHDVPILRHPGFAGVEFDAAARFFGHYNISLPDAPLFDPEFSNPLFLKIFCEAVSQGPDPHRLRPAAHVPSGMAGFTAVFDRFVARTNEKLVAELALNVDAHAEPVTFAVDCFAERMSELGVTSLPRAESAALVGRILISGKGASPLDRMFKEGLLARDVRYSPEREKGEEVVRFNYDRFAAHLIARQLLARHFDPQRPLESLVAGTPLGSMLADAAKWYRNASVAEALLVQLPETRGIELLDVLPAGTDLRQVAEPFIETIPWRRPDTITGRTKQLVFEVLRSSPGLEYKWLCSLLLMAARPGHPLNAVYLHEVLSRFSMSQRDVEWTPQVHRMGAAGEVVDRLIEWPFRQRVLLSSASEVIELAGTALAWTFTVTARPLRDRATKALVLLLQDHLDVAETLLLRFKEVNDPYVLERVLAAVYGACMRSENDAAVGAAAATIHRLFFAGGNPPLDILTRDYARGVVELAEHRGAAAGLDLAAARPPYGSKWVAEVPSKAELERLVRQPERGHEGWLKQVWDSVMGPFGDFGIYSLRKDWESFRLRGTPKRANRYGDRAPPFDRDLPHRFVVRRVAELGWPAIRPDPVRPRHPDYSRGRATVERAGKKYQWIAFREFLARVTDNFDFDGAWSDHFAAEYMGPWQLYERDVDPSFTLSVTHERQLDADSSWWWPFDNRTLAGQPDHGKWLRNVDDMPDPSELLAVTHPKTLNKWLLLSGAILQSEDVNPSAARHDRITRDLRHFVSAFFVRTGHAQALTQWLRTQRPGTVDLPAPLNNERPFWGEFPWAPINRLNEPGLFGHDDWDRGRGDAFPHPVIPVDDHYFLESGESDASIAGTVRLRIPGRWLTRTAGLRPSRTEGEFVDAAGLMVAFDPCVHECGPSVLLFRADALRAFLKQHDLSLIWYIAAEKNLIVPRSANWPGRLLAWGVYILDGAGRPSGSRESEFLTR